MQRTGGGGWGGAEDSTTSSSQQHHYLQKAELASVESFGVSLDEVPAPLTQQKQAAELRLAGRWVGVKGSQVFLALTQLAFPFGPDRWTHTRK